MIQFLRPHAWEDCNDFAQEILGERKDVSGIQVAKGLTHAVFETFYGTARFLSHKTVVGVVSGQSWAQTTSVQMLQREGLDVKIFEPSDLSEPQKILEALGLEASCFFLPEDHPVTGEKFSFGALEELLATKRILTIRLSHRSPLQVARPLGPYSVQICPMGSELAFVLLGARYRTPVQISAQMSWDLVTLKKQREVLISKPSENRDLILAIEKKVHPDLEVLVKGEDRHWDRLAVTSLRYSGEQILDHCGLEGAGQTLQLCHWGASLQDLSWWKHSLTPEQVRGLVVFSIQDLTSEKVQNFLASSVHGIT